MKLFCKYPKRKEKTNESYDEAILAAKALSSKKGLDIQIIKIADVSVLADYMVIATGTSSTHVKALADEVEYKLDQAGISVSHIEGYRSIHGFFLTTLMLLSMCLMMRPVIFMTLKDFGRTAKALT